MALNFPDSPTVGQIYTDTTSGFSYEWTGSLWKSYSAATASNIKILDDISGGFNNSTLTFTLTSNGSAVTPVNAQQLDISLGGVIQKPIDDYLINGSNITFTTAPSAGLSFFGKLLGSALPLNTIADGSVKPSSIDPTQRFDFANAYVSGNVGIGSTIPAATLDVNGTLKIGAVPGTNTNADFGVLFQTSTGVIDGGSTLTFNPSGDQLRVNGLSITSQTIYSNGSFLSLTTQNGNGTAQIEITDTTLQFKTGATERARFNASGNLGIGTTNPQYKLDVAGNSRFSQDIVVNSVNIGCGGISTTSVVVGAGAGTSGPGSENVFIGAGAGRSVTSAAYRNTAIGYQAMYNNDIGPTNTAIGYQALYSLNGYTYYNTAVGRYALGSLTSGTSNIALGHNAGAGITNGSSNICIGSGGPISGNSNIMIAGAGSSAGSSNILLGGTITPVTTTESYNVILGYITVPGAINNNIIIADGQGNERLRVNSTGNVGIGTTRPTTTLQVQGSSVALDTRIQSVCEETTLISGNTASLVYNTGGGNIAICTNATGDITLAVSGIPTDSTFNNNSITFSVCCLQTGVARSCTAVTLNGFNTTIRWAGGSLASAISGLTTTSGMDIYSFTGINTVGSASTTANYYVLGSVNGGYR